MENETDPRWFEPARGNCYQTAFLMLDVLDNHNVRLVHGIARRTREPFEFMGHAWLEFETRAGLRFVIDPQFPSDPIARDHYYGAGSVCYSVEYSLIRARRMHSARKDFGPWDQRVQNAAHADDPDPLAVDPGRDPDPAPAWGNGSIERSTALDDAGVGPDDDRDDEPAADPDPIGDRTTSTPGTFRTTPAPDPSNFANEYLESAREENDRNRGGVDR